MPAGGWCPYIRDICYCVPDPEGLCWYQRQRVRQQELDEQLLMRVEAVARGGYD